MATVIHHIMSAVSDALQAVAITVAGEWLDHGLRCLGVVGGCWS